MARHSAAESRFRVAGWVWAALLALILVIAMVVGWFILAGRHDGGTSAQNCIDGEQQLTVWADPAAEDVARQLVDRYNSGGPVVRDRCVTAVVDLKSTAEATEAYRRVEPGVAPVWIPAGTGFISGLSGAPDTVGIVATDDLVHYVPAGGNGTIGAAVLPSGPESMVSALAAEITAKDVDTGTVGEGPPLSELRDGTRPFLTSAALFGDSATASGELRTVGEVQFPLVAFGSSPSVDETSARAAADFAARADTADTVTPLPASPWLVGVVGALSGATL